MATVPPMEAMECQRAPSPLGETALQALELPPLYLQVLESDRDLVLVVPVVLLPSE